MKILRKNHMIFLAFLTACTTEKQPVYLDYLATTPCDQRVLEHMLPYFTQHFGNPHSLHKHGHDAYQAVEKARTSISRILHGYDEHRIVFTSGATEANNTLIKALAYAQKDKNHIITCVTEHKCILAACKQLEKEGFKVTYLPVSEKGRIDLKALENAITKNTFLITVMAVNNEIGIIHPIGEIGALCKKHNIFFHVDGAQAVGKIPLYVDEMHIDSLSLSGHKIYGPKGIGALYVREKLYQNIKDYPLLNGGGQEYNLRSGTIPTPLCVGIAKACDIAFSEMEDESVRIRNLRDMLYQELKSLNPNIEINGDLEHAIPGILSVRFPKKQKGGKANPFDAPVSYSTGSACSAGRSSYVLKALGIDENAYAIMRLSVGRFTKAEDIKQAVAYFSGVLPKF